MARMLPSNAAVAPAPVADLSTEKDRLSDVKRETSSPGSKTRKTTMSTKSNAQFGNDTIWARIAYHPYFESTTMFVIVCNAMWIGIDTEWNHANLKVDGVNPLHPTDMVVENLFCIYFSIELVVRFLAFRMKRHCFFDAWFVFDSILVGCMILETWVMAIVEAIMADDSGGGVGPLSALRLLRLLRLARVGRLMRFVPELGKLVKGMVKAARSVTFILIFLVMVIYVFAIVFTGTLSDRNNYPLTPYCSAEEDAGLNTTEDCLPDGEFGELAQDLFATMGDSFMSLFTRGVLGDNLDETVDAIMDAPGTGLILMWLFFIFLIITFATLLNMLIGVVCDVISDAAAEEEEHETVNLLKDTITDAFSQIDENLDGMVCQEEWQHIKDNPDVRKTLCSIGIEEDRMEERLVQMQQMLFDEDEDDNEPGVGSTATESTRSPSQSRQNSVRSADSRVGLNVEELIQRIVDIRPDQNANALDLELLKAQVLKDQKNFKAKLKRIEDGVRKTLGPGAGGHGADQGNMPNIPGMPDLPDILTGGETPLGRKNGDQVLLADVPTQMLFQALKDRSQEPRTAKRVGFNMDKAIHR